MTLQEIEATNWKLLGVRGVGSFLLVSECGKTLLVHFSSQGAPLSYESGPDYEMLVNDYQRQVLAKVLYRALG